VFLLLVISHILIPDFIHPSFLNTFSRLLCLIPFSAYEVKAEFVPAVADLCTQRIVCKLNHC